MADRETQDVMEEMGRWQDHNAAMRHDPETCEVCRDPVAAGERVSVLDTLRKVREKYGGYMSSADRIAIDLVLEIHGKAQA